ncbi:hypothetical protein VNO80_17930 [Phaseolus coccineus]|uniref:Uncharacterized protein n=1 Tax=Phaseolus coccineus TaxID=3886 RepID=A0AAN9MJD7_PHACN
MVQTSNFKHPLGFFLFFLRKKNHSHSQEQQYSPCQCSSYFLHRLECASSRIWLNRISLVVYGGKTTVQSCLAFTVARNVGMKFESTLSNTVFDMGILIEREVAVANGFVGLHQVGSLWRVWRPHSIRT